jgi:hypothetical protein
MRQFDEDKSRIEALVDGERQRQNARLKEKLVKRRKRRRVREEAARAAIKAVKEERAWRRRRS